MTIAGDPATPLPETVEKSAHVLELLSLLRRAEDLTAPSIRCSAAGVDDGLALFVARRMATSVIRPMRQAIGELGGDDDGPEVPAAPSTEDPAMPSGAPPSDLAQSLWELAVCATRLRVTPGIPRGVIEATAALQDLAIRFAPPDGLSSAVLRRAELLGMQVGLPSRIQASLDGPYFVTNAERLTTYLGVAVDVRPQMALCRCGASKLKPFCDGTHAEIGFTGAKDPDRVPDRRDTYAGQRITILDNRGTCAHAGFCSDRLATVFRVADDPFVAASGGRMDEIIRAVRACPSGALSYALDGAEARDQVDQPRQPDMEIAEDGPYRVTGGIAIIDDGGEPEKRNEGASLEHYSLCRCGHSKNKPFCSGMHWTVNFRDPAPNPDREPTLFEWAGGLPAFLRLTRVFYEKYVPEDPILAPLFARMSADHPERVAAWLAETFGGPSLYTDLYGGYDHMVSEHKDASLTEDQRSRWASLMYKSADDAHLPPDPEFRAAFAGYIEWGSRIALENSQPGVTPPKHLSVPRWWWVCNATPDARISALAPHEPDAVPVDLPGPEETVSFEQHIKPLFRPTDRSSMTFAFDLWAYPDVVSHAQAILDRLRAGTMPCDHPWPAEMVDVFSRWIATGTPS